MKPLSHLDSKNANLPLGLGLETLSLNPEGCTWKGTLHVEQCITVHRAHTWGILFM